MSFNDWNDVESQTGSVSNEPTASPEFQRLTQSISQKIFTITSNVAQIHRYIGLLGTHRDTERMRASFMEALSRTKDVSKEIVPEIRLLARWDQDEIGPNEKYEQQKLTGEFQKAALDFQNAQRLALDKQKVFVKDKKAAIEEERAEFEDSPDGRGQRVKRPRQVGGLQVLDNSEIEFNERLIEEREKEIQGIEQSILELNEIFRDLGTMVTEQGLLLGTSGHRCDEINIDR
jgi:hypothetical protein